MSSNRSENLPARRKLLGAMASVAGISAAGLLGAHATSAAGATGAGVSMLPGGAPEDLLAQARLRSYKTRRSSSWTAAAATATPCEWKQARRPRCWTLPVPA
jgi:hypothetical protein